MKYIFKIAKIWNIRHLVLSVHLCLHDMRNWPLTKETFVLQADECNIVECRQTKPEKCSNLRTCNESDKPISLNVRRNTFPLFSKVISVASIYTLLQKRVRLNFCSKKHLVIIQNMHITILGMRRIFIFYQTYVQNNILAVVTIT